MADKDKDKDKRKVLVPAAPTPPPPVAPVKVALKLEQPKQAPRQLTLALEGVLWKEPYPAAVLDATGKDTVFVRVTPVQDLRIAGTVLKAGVETTMPCSMAHAHAHALRTPKR